MKNIKFNVYGLVLFIIIMMPNFIWFAIPSQNDILRNESLTPLIDNLAIIFQVIMIFFLCFISNKVIHKNSILSFFMIGLYFICWILYYLSIVNIVIILGLCLFPSFSFIFYEIKNKNWIALVPTIIFSILHLIYGIVNFM